MRFWDSSALVTLIVSQRKTAEMRSLLNQDPAVLVWWATPVECVSAISRMVRESALTETDADTAVRNLRLLIDACDIVEPREAVRKTAMRLVRVHPLRSADAIQLAAAWTACSGNPGDLPVVCLDTRLSLAAGKEGFVVLS